MSGEMLAMEVLEPAMPELVTDDDEVLRVPDLRTHDVDLAEIPALQRTAGVVTTYRAQRVCGIVDRELHEDGANTRREGERQRRSR